MTAPGSSVETFPLSPAQRAILVGQLADTENYRFNAALYFKLPPETDTSILLAAASQLAKESRLQRVALQSNDGEWTQSVTIPSHRITQVHRFATTEQAMDWIQAEFKKPFQLDRGLPLYQQWLLHIDAAPDIFFVKYHHLVLDGFGQNLLLKRLEELYRHLAQGAPLSESGWSSDHEYFEAVANRQQNLSRTDRAKSELQRYANLEEVVTLGRNRSSFAKNLCQSRYNLGNRVVDNLKRNATFFNVPESVLLTTLIASYMHRVTGQERIVLGLPVSARTRRALLTKPSMQSNEWPLDFDFSNWADTNDTTAVSNLIAHAKLQMATAVSNQETRNEELHRLLGRAGWDEKLTKTLVNILPFGSALSLTGPEIPVQQLATGPVGDLTINAFLSKESLNFLWDANPENYSQTQLDRHAERFVVYLEDSLQNLSNGVIPTAPRLKEDRELANKLIGKQRDWDLETPLFIRIDHQAELTPNAIAVECDQYQLTYAQLKAITDTYGQKLLAGGIQPGAAVGVFGTRSTLMAVAILAIQKAGGAYVPLDPELPKARLQHQVKEAGIQLILHWGVAPDLGINTQVQVQLVSAWLDQPDFNTDIDLPEVRAHQPAYIIFTSGSTGQPKGVSVSHAAIANRIQWMQDQYGLTTTDAVLQKTPFTFDVSVWEFFWPLVVGARLVMAAPGTHKDPRELWRTIEQHEITTLHFVPPMLDLFLQEAPQGSNPIRRIFCSGEALKPATVGETFKQMPEVELHNLYGPTEAAVDVTYWPCSPDDATRSTVPIGWPVANTPLWVLDAAMRPALPGVPGELYIGGPQVALGYVNQPELTAERFVEVEGVEGVLYRTGDLVVLTEDSGLEFMGRLDHQVKIRGLRIELAEIESALMALPAVRQAVVCVHQNDTPNPILVAYLVMQDTNAVAELRTQIATTLPDYMIPTHWIPLNELPLMPNGKVNRRALPVPERQQDSTQAESEAERLLQSIWKDVLGLDEVGMETPFFSLGGDSMMAIRVRTAIEQQGWTFELAELFRNPTIRQLSAQLSAHKPVENIRREPFESLNEEDLARLPAGLEDAFPMSAMQESMAYQAEIDQSSSVYRVVTSLTLERPLEREHLETALNVTLQRHPLLRSSFDLSSFSRPLVLVHAQVEAPVYYEQPLAHLNQTEQRSFIQSWVEDAKFQTFELNRAPGLRFYVHPLAVDRFQLSVVEHHVVLDGWSDLLMLDEIVDYYDRLLDSDPIQTEPLLSHYADFVATETQLLNNEEARRFWQGVTAGVDASPLPRRDTQGQTSHRSYHADIPRDLNDALMTVASEHRCSIKSLLVAAHLTALSAITGNRQVATGSVFNGRLDHPDSDKVIGVFLNTLPLSLSLDDLDYIALAKQVAEFEYRSHAFGRYPFTTMQRETDNELNLDSYVNYMDFHRQWGEGSVVSNAFGVANTNFPLAVNFLVDPVSQTLSLWFDCDLGTLDPCLCERLPDYYLTLLRQIARDPLRPVLSTELITPRERWLLEYWNQTELSYDSQTLVHQQFEQQAERTPERAAVSYLDTHLSYSQLNQLANRIARALVDAGVEANETVGVCVPRCPELIASLLAIHKVGAAFLPLDPKYPLDRLNYIVEDAGLDTVLTHAISPLLNARVNLAVDDLDHSADNTNLNRAVDPQATAYSIYTSGSTGRPKGAIVTHRNLLNFLAGMDNAVGCEADDTLLALTSASFDISILEMFWPLTKGAKVVLGGEHQIQHLSDQQTENQGRPLDFSLFFFGAASGMDSRHEAYQLVMDAARFADSHHFKAIWTPERHFHEFGGLYPNPSVLSAALASITHHIELRSGSVVAPLHDSIRMAEEWALVDNLSQGRVGLAFASGWNSNDFALAPENYANRKTVMLEKLKQLRTLWSGDSLPRVNGDGKTVELSIYPRPVRTELPIWLTSAGAVSTFEMAGTYGLNVLTHLLGQDIQELTDKIAAYRTAWKAAGHEGEGHVSLMVHTFLLPNEQQAKTIAKEPFREYLRTSAGLLRQLTASMGIDFPEAMDSDDMESILDLAVDRYFETSGLFGSPDSVAPLLQQLQSAGVDEIASLIDFGISNEDTLTGLASINNLRLQHEREHRQALYSCERLIREHRVTLMQSTPSFMTAAMSDPALVDAMGGLNRVLIGGEPFPAGLATQLNERLPGRVFNMYGPTETTIWSSVHQVTADSLINNRIPIGRPIANTKIKVLNTAGQTTPIGVPGELWIGGDGVCAGYWQRPDLTAERFQVLDDGQLYYRTGDRVCWLHTGELLFLGRVDRQVKLRGHRIELDEIEGVLSRHEALRSVAVVLQANDQGAQELLAYVEADSRALNSDETLERVNHWGQLWDNAYRGRDSLPDPAGRAADFAGWLSSYTGDPIPVEEMEEWLDQALRKVEAYHPKKIIDVGVGMGLYLRRLIHQCEHYTGIDLSEEALRASKIAAASALAEGRHLQLIQGDALALRQLPDAGADLVLVNSVVQYFPSERYLTDMLTEACRVLTDTGVVFLGDIRSLDELALFHTQVQFEKAGPLTTVGEINTLIQRHLKLEKELCLSPAYFAELNKTLEDIQDITLELKRGHAANELNDFRYDAVIHRHRNKKSTPTEWTNEESALSNQVLENIAQRVKTTQAEQWVVRNLPNHRLDRIRHIETLLRDMDPAATKWDIEKRLWELQSDTPMLPEALAQSFEHLGYQVRLLIHPDRGLNCFDLELTIDNRKKPATGDAQQASGVMENTL